MLGWCAIQIGAVVMKAMVTWVFVQHQCIIRRFRRKPRENKRGGIAFHHKLMEYLALKPRARLFLSESAL